MVPAVREVAPARSDALRNRSALIDAARQVFGERGLDAPLDEIARQAGTGNATLYRHFPNRCDLVAAVFAKTLEQVALACERGLANPDPWAGFAQHVVFLCELQANDRGLADLLTTSISGAPELERLRSRIQRDFFRLAERAKEAGELRADFQPEDLAVLLMANAGVVHRTAVHASTSWRRLVHLVLDGLRQEAATGVLPPSPGIRAVRAVMADQGTLFRLHLA